MYIDKYNFNRSRLSFQFKILLFEERHKDAQSMIHNRGFCSLNTAVAQFVGFKSTRITGFNI